MINLKNHKNLIPAVALALFISLIFGTGGFSSVNKTDQLGQASGVSSSSGIVTLGTFTIKNEGQTTPIDIEGIALRTSLPKSFLNNISLKASQENILITSQKLNNIHGYITFPRDIINIKPQQEVNFALKIPADKLPTDQDSTLNIAGVVYISNTTHESTLIQSDIDFYVPKYVGGDVISTKPSAKTTRPFEPQSPESDLISNLPDKPDLDVLYITTYPKYERYSVSYQQNGIPSGISNKDKKHYINNGEQVAFTAFVKNNGGKIIDNFDYT